MAAFSRIRSKLHAPRFTLILSLLLTFYIPTRYSAGEARALLNDDHVGLATSLVREKTNLVEDRVDLARRRSRFAAFVTLKSVCLGAIFCSLRSAVELAT